MKIIKKDNGRVRFEAKLGDSYIALTLNVDEIRGLYYAALGMEPPQSTLKKELDSLTAKSFVSVDEPADVSKVERVQELRLQQRCYRSLIN